MLPLKILAFAPARPETALEELRNASFECTCQSVDNIEDFCQQLHLQTYDLILLDNSTGEQDVEAVIQAYRATLLSLPVVLITPPCGEEKVADYLHLGVADVVINTRMQRLLEVAKKLFYQRYAYSENESPTTTTAFLHRDYLAAIISQIPAVIWLTDTNLIFTMSDGAGVKIVGHRPNEVVGKSLMELIGTTDESAVPIRAHREALKGKSVKYRQDIFDRTFEAYVEPLRDGSGKIVGCLGQALDVTEAEIAQRGLKRCDEILQAAGRAAKNLLLASPWREMMNEILADVGKAGEVSRAYVFQNHQTASGELVMSQLFEWVGPGVAPEIDNPELQNLPYKEAGFTRWVETLSQRDVIHGHVNTFPQGEQDILSPQGIFSIVVAPIFVENAWWGFIGFDECNDHRVWTSAEIGALCSTADLIGASIQRDLVRKRLETTEKRYALATEAARVGVWDWNLETDEFYLDPHIKALLGYEDHEIPNDLSIWSSYVFPPDHEKVMKAANDHLKGKTPQYELEHRMVHKDGSLRWIQVRGTAIRNKEGKATRLLGTDEDITERRRAADALKESERFLATLLSNMPGIVYRCRDDRNFTMEFLSHGCFDVTGYRPGDLLANNKLCFVDLIHPEDREYVWQVIHEDESLDAPFQVNYRIITSSGKIKWVWEQGRRITDPTGEGFWLEGFIDDITPMKEAEEESMLLATAIEQASEAVIITDNEGNIEYVNPAFERTSGYSRREALGRNPRFLKSGKHNEKFYKTMWTKITTGHVWHGRMTNRRKDGTLYDEESSITPVRNRLGLITNFVAVKRDITHELAVESHMRQQQKMESIGTLASGVAHEINNPLNVIMNYAQLIMDEGDSNTTQVEYAKEIVIESERVASIVRDLLAFSRRERQTHIPLRLQDIISSTLTLIRAVMRHDQITLTIDVPEDLPKVRCSGQQIQQVLLNLITNARDSLNQRFPGYHQDKYLKVYAQEIEKNNVHWVRMTIEDNGAGIAKEIRERIFDPFFTTKSRTEGTGLGLSISHAIIQDHLGELWCESEIGHPTRFHIDLCMDHRQLIVNELAESS